MEDAIANVSEASRQLDRRQRGAALEGAVAEDCEASRQLDRRQRCAALEGTLLPAERAKTRSIFALNRATSPRRAASSLMGSTPAPALTLQQVQLLLDSTWNGRSWPHYLESEPFSAAPAP